MSCHREWFYSFATLARPIRVTLGDDSAIHATGVGRIPVRMRANGHWSNAVLQDVLFVPELNGNLLSVAHLTQRGADVRFTGQTCQLYTQAGELTCSGQLQGKLYIMDMRTVVPETARIARVDTFPAEGDDLPAAAETALVARSSTSRADVDTWHRRLAHLNTDASPVNLALKASKLAPRSKRPRKRAQTQSSAAFSPMSAENYRRARTAASNTS